jgi:hypothetical protein
MVYFQTKKTRFGKFCRVLQDTYVFYGHLVYFMVIWYICWSFSRFGMLFQEKSGNPDSNLYAMLQGYCNTDNLIKLIPD